MATMSTSVHAGPLAEPEPRITAPETAPRVAGPMSGPVSGPAAAAARRDDVDTIRAIACIALVSFHAVGSSPAAGLELGPDHWMSVLNASLIHLRMPLFSFVSGYVFARMIRDAPGSWAGPRGGPPWRRIVSKMRRLLLPMACVGALFWMARAGTGQAQMPLPAILVLPFAHFWFLQATFLIMAAFLLATWASGGRGTPVAAAMMAAGVAAWLAAPMPSVNVFSVIQAFYLLPFFMAGHLLARSGITGPDALAGARTRSRAGVRAAAVLAVAASVATGTALATGALVPPPGLERAVPLVLGLVFCCAIFLARPQSALLARLGRQSYAIYLFHVFFTAAAREAILRMAPGTDPALIWPLSLAAGLAGPVIVQAAALRVPLAALLLLGVRQRRPDRRPPGSGQAGDRGAARHPGVLILR